MRLLLLTAKSFWGVFWVDVGSQSTTKNSFLAIAKALGRASEEGQQLPSLGGRYPADDRTGDIVMARRCVHPLQLIGQITEPKMFLPAKFRI